MMGGVLLWMTAGLLGSFGCSKSVAPSPAAEEVAAETPEAVAPADAKRPFAPTVDGKRIRHGISYGPYRENQAPGGPNPTAEQILEDLNILKERWSMIRFYGSTEPAETILKVIRDNDLPIVAMVGAWIAHDKPDENAEQVAEAIRLANAYPEQVFAVSVGNESQVFWSAHRSDRAELIGYLKQTRAAVKQPVTTADDYNFWNKPESHEVADVVDFIVLHAYAMWNGKQLDEAVPWTAETIAAIRAEHPDHEIVIGETGWATELNPEGSEGEHIKAPAGTAEQKQFYAEWVAWATEADVAYFYFSAFDEPWKGSPDPREVEKHWGLYGVDRNPKPALQ
ncbi:MAG: glycosyl hydrolase family 17 protein [Myxococcota bacterium]